ncbi:MAG: FAD:protein FMN transferase [Bryobacteraceae bacterium]|nr:FAD:protein FMN transferase [Bryobacteraceae bacterium]
MFLGAWTLLQGGDLLRLEQSLDAMGSVYTVVAYGEDRAKMIAAVDQAFEEVRRLDRMLSNYRRDSELSRLNRDAASGPVHVSEELFQLLDRCQSYSQASEGAFDITVGPLMKIWGFYKGSGRLPHRAEIRGVFGRIGYRNLELDPKARTVRFRKAGMELDPGGIGKGYAVDRMVEILKEDGIGSALISAGSSSIYALGSPPNEDGWPVSIRHPRDLRKGVEEVRLRDQSMSTSGTTEKFFRAEGRLYSHIMDPRTGYPAQGVLSVSVIAPKTLDSEAWTKPFFVNGRAWSQKNRPKHFRVFLCENKGGTDQACAWLQ